MRCSFWLWFKTSQKGYQLQQTYLVVGLGVFRRVPRFHTMTSPLRDSHARNLLQHRGPNHCLLVPVPNILTWEKTVVGGALAGLCTRKMTGWSHQTDWFKRKLELGCLPRWSSQKGGQKSSNLLFSTKPHFLSGLAPTKV